MAGSSTRPLLCAHTAATTARLPSLDFLRHFPTLRRFSADCLFNSLTNIDGLGYLPADVEDLGLGHTRARRSLALLARFKNLTRLFIEGHTKNIDVVGELRRLPASPTFGNPSQPGGTHALQDLRALDLKLGGTRNLELLPQVGQLGYLEIWMVKGLSDLSPLLIFRSWSSSSFSRCVSHVPACDVQTLPRCEGCGLRT